MKDNTLANTAKYLLYCLCIGISVVEIVNTIEKVRELGKKQEAKEEP